LTETEPHTTKPNALARPWAFWVLFFFQYAAIAVYFTYLNVYYRDANLTGTQIGVINMVSALMSVISAVIWGNISDRTGKPRLLIAGGALGALVVAQFVPTVSTFEAFFGLALLGAAMGSAPATLADSTTLAWLGDRREDYARYRLGGTIGYILTGTLIGFVFDRMGLTLMFPLYGAIMFLFAFFALFLPDLPVRVEAKSRQAITMMMRQPAWIVLVLSVFLVWIATNASIMFMGVVLDSMGATQGLIGVAVTVGAIVEVPFMMASPWLLRRFGSVRLLVVALILMVVRYSLLSWMPAPEWAVPINALNGPAFVLFWNGAINLANKMAPPGLAGTAQGLLNSVMSLSGMVSALLTGVLFDRLGPNGMFLVMAFCVLAALALFTIANLRLIRRDAPVRTAHQ
jgi:PPP family 3-phenylpropionic acid transporter